MNIGDKVKVVRISGGDESVGMDVYIGREGVISDKCEPLDTDPYVWSVEFTKPGYDFDVSGFAEEELEVIND